MTVIERITDQDELRTLAELADRIWHECFVGIISAEQIDYMVDKFQSYNAMLDQISKQGYSYCGVYDDGELCGYIGMKPESDNRFFLSKLYLRSDKRGRGIATQMMNRVYDEARACGKDSVYLTVNKHNTHAIEVYKKLGYIVADETVTNIGSGFVMDDFVMQHIL